MLRILWRGLFHFVVLIFFSTYSFAQERDKGENLSDPFKVSVTYTGDLWGNFSGGLDTGMRYMDNIDINLEIDFGALPLGLKGTTLYIYGLGNQGGSISELAGDFQGISNIEAPNSWRFFEIWAQKKFFLANSSLLLGLYDINSEFNVLDSSLLFLNSSHGLDAALAASGVLGPSTFPYTSMAGRFKVNPVGGLVIQTAVLDGIPSNPESPRGTKIYWRERDGLLYLAEIAFYSVSREGLQLRNRTVRLRSLLGRESSGQKRYKFAVGGWAYSKKRPGWSSDGSEERDMGAYALGEYQVFSEPGNTKQGLTLFGRVSVANGAINRLAGYLGGGLIYHGLLNSRPEDDIGLAVAHAVSSSSYIDQSPFIEGYRAEDAETNLEFTYLVMLNSSVSLQGNLQYAINPNMDPDLDNAFSVAMRLILSF